MELRSLLLIPFGLLFCGLATLLVVVLLWWLPRFLWRLVRPVSFYLHELKSWESSLDVKERSIAKLGTLGTSAVPALLSFFKQHTYNAPECISEAPVKACGPTGAEPLVQELASAGILDRFVKWVDDRSMPKMIEIMAGVMGSSECREVQRNIATTLCRVDSVLLVPVAQTLLQSIRAMSSSQLASYRDRRAKVELLAKIGEPAFLELLEACYDPDYSIRLVAIWGLARIGLAAKNAYPTLITLLYPIDKTPADCDDVTKWLWRQRQHRDVRAAAFVALPRIGGSNLREVVDALTKALNRSFEFEYTVSELVMPRVPKSLRVAIKDYLEREQAAATRGSEEQRRIQERDSDGGALFPTYSANWNV